MFVPFVYTLDTLSFSGNYMFWMHFYWYVDACIKNKWPIISHERYFERLSHVEETMFGTSLRRVATVYCMSKVPTTEDILALKAYPVSQTEEDSLIAKHRSQFDCWVDLLQNENSEFEQVIGELLDMITCDFGEKPEGILIYENLPKALLTAVQKRGIPVIFQGGGVLRPPFAAALNAFSLINGNSAELIQSKYDRFLSENAGVPMLSRKGILRLFAVEQYLKDVHNIDAEPEYDVGVLYNNTRSASQHIKQECVTDKEMSARAQERYDRVLIRTRPGFKPTEDALDDSPTCFHFCCKCERVLGFATKGVFEAMLAGRVAHEYGSFIFHSFCNDGIEDGSKGIAPIEFINFVIFGLCTPFQWLTDPDYLRFLLSNPSEKDLYMRSFDYFTRGISREDLEFYYMCDNRAYRLGDPLYFTSGHLPHRYASYYCKKGLHVPEETHTWSEGDVTEFEFDLGELPEEDLILSVALHSVTYNQQKDSQTVRCEVNGWVCGEASLSYASRLLEFKIPQSRVSNKLNIQFFYDNPTTVQCDEWQRSISIAFEAVKISREGQYPFETALRTETDNLRTEIIGLSEELSNIKNSRAYRRIMMPIWRINAKIRPK